MAGATINGSTGNQYIDCKIVWSSTPTNSTNKSEVTAALYYKRNNTGFTTYGEGTFTISIGGIKTSVTKSLTITESAWVKAVEATETISHNPDGSKSITISATGSIPSTSLSSTTCTGTAKLDTIPRATVLDSLSCATNYFTGKMTYKYTPQSASYYNRCNISLSINGEYIRVKSIDIGKKSASQQTATVTLSSSELAIIYNELPSTDKGTLRFTFRTYSDSGYSTQVGDADYKEVTLYIPNDSTTKPSVSAILAPLGFANNTIYLQKKSKVKATITSSGLYEAKVTATKMEVEGKSYDSGDNFTSDYLTGYGDNVKVKVTVTDSRGFSNSVTKAISVEAYSKPKLLPATGEKSIICARCDADGNLTDSGTSLKVKVKRSYTKLSGRNEAVITCSYKASNASSYPDDNIDLVIGVSDADEAEIILFDGKLSAENSYTALLSISDLANEKQTIEYDIPTDKIYMDRAGSRRSLGIGKYAEADNAIDVADDMTLLLGGNKAEAVVSSSKGDISGSIKFASGLVMQWGNVTITPTAENEPTVSEVTYPIRFKYTPFVVINPATTVPGKTVTGACAASVTETKFDATLTRTNLSPTHLRWLAIGFSE